MSGVGNAIWVNDENHMYAFTTVSGTGPVYFYLVIEIMIEAAINNGIDPEVARTLAVETARGASALSAATEEEMKAMIEKVSSPGGTTMAAFEYLAAKDAKKIFSKVIDVATKRASELAKEAN